jgi:hypothetical protein
MSEPDSIVVTDWLLSPTSAGRGGDLSLGFNATVTVLGDRDNPHLNRVHKLVM